MTCECGFEFSFEGFRNFGIAIKEDGSKIIICPKCGEKYVKETK